MEKIAATRIQNFQKGCEYKDYRDRVDRFTVNLRNKKRIDQQNEFRKQEIQTSLLKTLPEELLIKYPELNSFKTCNELVNRLVNISCCENCDETAVLVLEFLSSEARVLFYEFKDVFVSHQNAVDLIRNLKIRHEKVVKKTMKFIAHLVENTLNYRFPFILNEFVLKILPLLQSNNLELTYYVLKVLSDLTIAINQLTSESKSSELHEKIMNSINHVLHSTSLITTQNKGAILRYYRYANPVQLSDKLVSKMIKNLLILIDQPDTYMTISIIETITNLIQYEKLKMNDAIDFLPQIFAIFEVKSAKHVNCALNFFKYLTSEKDQKFTQILLNNGTLIKMMKIFENSDLEIKKSIASVIGNILTGTEAQAMRVLKFSFNIIETFLSHPGGSLFAEGVVCIFNTVLQRSAVLNEKILSLSLIPEMLFHMSLKTLASSQKSLGRIQAIMKVLQKNLSSVDWVTLQTCLSELGTLQKLEDMLFHSKNSEITTFLNILINMICPSPEPQPIMQNVSHFSL